MKSVVQWLQIQAACLGVLVLSWYETNQFYQQATMVLLVVLGIVSIVMCMILIWLFVFQLAILGMNALGM